ncbi:unnamed protein product [Ceutorhynchus assimilis]|uniref:Uncharacterized protein n=1 Tax=Ceutorhynchus assimilis TaxID=467358 RepID=A0A9N9ME31_9CUCU|nr:unnamed protein product [Ceutorhynchus assimilis]
MYSGSEEVRQKNPRQTSNLLSFLTFGYTLQLFKKGNLQESDIYEVPTFCSSKRCGDKIDQDWQYCKSTLRLLIKRFGNKYFLYTAIHTTWDLFRSTILPYAMSRFIAYFEKNQTRITKQDSYFYGFTIIFVYIFQSLWIHNYFTLECTLGTQIRSSITSLIYRKVIKLRPDQVKGSSMGSIVTILTKDIRTIESTIWPLSDTILGLIKFFYLSYLLYIRIGIPSLVVTGLMAMTVALQAILSKFVLKLRLKVGKKADERLQFTREILSAIKIIKMYTWEMFFHRRICEARKKETKANVRSWYLGYFIIGFGTMFAKLLFPVFLLSYISFGYSIDTELVYYLMGLFKEFASVIGSLLPNGFGLTAEFYASVVRIGRILNMEEHLTDPKEKYKTLDRILAPAKLNFQNISLSIDGEAILSDLTLCIDKPGLYMFSGPLGSGKTSILKIILEEYSPTRGHFEIFGNMSYASQDPWLFPATVRQNILFGQSFDSERYDKIIEICSLRQDLTHLPNGDNTVVIDGGLNLSKGQQARVNLARAIYKQSDIYLLDDPLACLDVKVQDDIFQVCIKQFLKDKIVVLVTQNNNHLKHANKLYILEHGRIKTIIKPDEEIFDNNKNQLIIMPINVEKHHKLVKIYHEDKNIGSVDVKNYYRYVKYGGGILVFGFLISVFFLAQLTESYSDKLVSQWVDYQQNTTITTNEEISYQRDNTFDMYIIMIVFSTVIDLVQSYWFLAYCRKASIRFHKLMSQSVINCVMTFMDNHFVGNILNRFSYDLDHIDEVFPFLFRDLIIAFFGIGGTLILILTVDWIFLIIMLLFFVTLVVLRAFYIPAARALKRLGAITRSPFIGHLNATVDGLSTIRAFKQESLLKNEFDKHQDLAISVAYMEMLTERAFGYALDLDCSIFISLVILTFLFVDTDTSVGNVGLALTQVFTMSSYLQWIVRTWASIEQCMTSVERVVEYTKIPQENAILGENLSNWPKYGQIEYRNVNLIYNFQSRVLKNVSFLIKPGQKVGIVGRTGAGKSSIITTLFRLYEYQGNIVIDGVDISKLSLQFLRSNIAIIPQDPTIFQGTIRENIDPYGTCLDKDIWRSLKNVKLEAWVPSLDENILNLSLSTGQKQLICFARALLKNNSVVVMDEPTANLDTETDRLLHDLIKLNFSQCTLIMVAHRLDSILDFDKVMVMENGEVVEFDNPRKLLEDTGSFFWRMVNVIK